MPRVTFMPEDITVEVTEGVSLLRAAVMADVLVTASCGGDGRCGKCRMVVQEGAVRSRSSAKLTDEDVARGYVLACLTEVTADVVVSVPPESRPGHAPSAARSRRPANTVLSAADAAARIPRVRSAPAVTKRLLRLPPPSLTDNASDLTRVARTLRREHRVRNADVTLEALRALPAAAREGEWTVTATVAEPPDATPWVSAFDAGDTAGRQYAVAVDVGTTAVEVALLELPEGARLAQAAEYNAQVSRGEDVISRVVHAEKENGLADLQTLVIRTIGELVERVCADAGISAAELSCYAVAGNTVMTHLLYGVSPSAIRPSPYTPAATFFPWVSAGDLSLPGGPGTEVAAMPCPASWLGGDVVAGIVASGMPWSDKLTLFIDIGTNGEIVLGNKDWMVACSCSAGPAFEGGGIRHGMRAADGAIEQVRVDPETLAPTIITIGGVKPVGVCGSGLVDCVTELLLAGAIDRNGRFAEGLDSPHVRRGERGPEYVLAMPEHSGTGDAVVLTEADIHNLMRAKAAIFAGITVLAESLDVAVTALDEVVVAGGFGHYLDLEHVMALGMIPELDPEKFVFLGNGSLAGARLAATSREMMRTARTVAEMMTYLELSVNAGFMEAYVSALFLPHTDLSLFPRTELMLRSDAAAGAVT